MASILIVIVKKDISLPNMPRWDLNINYIVITHRTSMISIFTSFYFARGTVVLLTFNQMYSMQKLKSH